VLGEHLVQPRRRRVDVAVADPTGSIESIGSIDQSSL